jgi:PAS domain S-box-containing protein
MEEELHLTQFSVDRASIGIMRTGVDARILSVNEKICQSLGYTKQELCNMHIYDIDPSFPLEEWQKHRKRLQNLGSDVFETTHRRKDGTTFPVEITANYIEYGGSGYSFSFIRDITERKKMMEALKASEASWRARTDELESLFSLAARLRQSQTTNDMLQIVLREIQQVVKSDAVAIAFHDKNHQNFRVVGGLGPLAPQIGQIFRDDEGISGVVLRTQTTYITEDYSPDLHRMSDPDNLFFANDTGPAVCVPLRSENEFLGTIYASRRRGLKSRLFTSEEERLLAAIGEMAGNTLRRARLFEDVQKHLRRTQALHDIQLAVTSSFDLQLTLNVVLEQCLIQLEVDAAAVLIFDPNLTQLKYAAGRGFKTSQIENNRPLGSNSPIYQVAVQRQTVFISNLSETSDQFRESLPIGNEDFAAYCGVPLITKGQIKGALEIFHRAQLSEDSEWLSFLETLAGQVAIAIDNLTMFTDLQQSNLQLSLAYDDTIQGLSRALELRDRETKGHSDRVTDLTTQLAQKMGINGVNLIHIRRGAMLHDIGKVGIPDTILLKPGKLTEEEWQIVRQHPQYAYNILSPIKYLQPALDIPYCHHEKWDGSGYPQNLRGEDIPFAARIFAVVDVWDALTSDRPYREPLDPAKVRQIIQEGSGKHFDPQVVDAFLGIKDLPVSSAARK